MPDRENGILTGGGLPRNESVELPLGPLLLKEVRAEYHRMGVLNGEVPYLNNTASPENGTVMLKTVPLR